jgi:hypothetical protein
VQDLMDSLVRALQRAAKLLNSEQRLFPRPLPPQQAEEQSDREQWPWLPGTTVEQCGPDEWYVRVEVRELAVLRDGRRAPRGTASRDLYYPCCFRDRSEIRPRTASRGAASATSPDS